VSFSPCEYVNVTISQEETMGARGRIKEYGKPIPIPFPKGVETHLRYFAALDGISVAALVRTLVREGLERRIPRRENRARELQRVINELIDYERAGRWQRPEATKETPVRRTATPAVYDEERERVSREYDEEELAHLPDKERQGTMEKRAEGRRMMRELNNATPGV
jgi:hypothetical protein